MSDETKTREQRKARIDRARQEQLESFAEQSRKELKTKTTPHHLNEAKAAKLKAEDERKGSK